jgi:hypothetical protein
MVSEISGSKTFGSQRSNNPRTRSSTDALVRSETDLSEAEATANGKLAPGIIRDG